jgi:hypothetical protein
MEAIEAIHSRRALTRDIGHADHQSNYHADLR